MPNDCESNLLFFTGMKNFHWLTVGSMDLFKKWLVGSDKVQQAFETLIQPLETKCFSHFNFSAILFMDGNLEDWFLRENVFLRILQNNQIEPLLLQLLSVMFVAADRCRESISPKAQASLRNGIVLIVRDPQKFTIYFYFFPHCETSTAPHALSVQHLCAR